MNSYFSVQTLKSVFSNLPAKIGFSIVTFATGVHAQLVVLFSLMAFMDVFTRWCACAAALWKDLYPNTPGSFWKYFKFLRQAHRWRYFRSEKMRDQFISKIGTYTVIIIICALGDTAMSISRGIPFLLTVGVSILSCTEAISCLENLNECNISIAKEIVALVRRRKEQIK